MKDFIRCGAQTVGTLQTARSFQLLLETGASILVHLLRVCHSDPTTLRNDKRALKYSELSTHSKRKISSSMTKARASLADALAVAQQLAAEILATFKCTAGYIP